mgnify:CR=1 FL=1
MQWHYTCYDAKYDLCVEDLLEDGDLLILCLLLSQVVEVVQGVRGAAQVVIPAAIQQDLRRR